MMTDMLCSREVYASLRIWSWEGADLSPLLWGCECWVVSTTQIRKKYLFAATDFLEEWQESTLRVEVKNFIITDER